MNVSKQRSHQSPATKPLEPECRQQALFLRIDSIKCAKAALVRERYYSTKLKNQLWWDRLGDVLPDVQLEAGGLVLDGTLDFADAERKLNMAADGCFDLHGYLGELLSPKLKELEEEEAACVSQLERLWQAFPRHSRIKDEWI